MAHILLRKLIARRVQRFGRGSAKMHADEMLNRRAGEISDSLDAFSTNARVFSSDAPRLIDLYKDKWVGVYHGEVTAAEDTLESVTDALIARGIPLGDAMIRRIDREEKTLIL